MFKSIHNLIKPPTMTSEYKNEYRIYSALKTPRVYGPNFDRSESKLTTVPMQFETTNKFAHFFFFYFFTLFIYQIPTTKKNFWSVLVMITLDIKWQEYNLNIKNIYRFHVKWKQKALMLMNLQVNIGYIYRN